MRPRLASSLLLLATLALPLAASAEPPDIMKYRFRGEGVSIQLGTPPNPCIMVTDRGILSAAANGTNNGPRTPSASFHMAVDNTCTNESFVVYGQMAAPDLAFTVSGGGKVIGLRGTLPITTENLQTGSKTSEQVTFDLVLTASSDGRRRRRGAEHVDLQDRGYRSISTYDLREYANVTAVGTFAGTVAGLPVGMGNIGNYLIQTEQDRMVQIQKF